MLKTIVITGASDGIGAAAAGLLAAGSEHRLVLVGRDPGKTRRLAESLGAKWHAADFEQLNQVRALADALLAGLDRIDVLANNAGGIFNGPVITADGFERSFQVNHLAPVLLTNLLIDRLLASQASVINTASIGAKLYSRLDFRDLQSIRRFKRNRAYGNAKLANILFASGLHAHYHAAGLNAMSFHPGVIASNFAAGSSGYMNSIYHGWLRRYLTPVSRGGENLAYFVAGSPGREWRAGEFYDDRRKPGPRPKISYDPAVVERHWQATAKLLDISWPTRPPQ